MTVKLIRHGKTQGNLDYRYIGSTDEPVMEGYHHVRMPGHSDSAKLYCSPMYRCIQTAGMLFPDLEPEIVQDLREMDFGLFEGRNYIEMEDDPEYRKWVEGKCKERCPGGDHPQEFFDRVCAAFEKIVTEGGDEIIIVTHGGVIPGIMRRFCSDSCEMEFRKWMIPNLSGLEMDLEYSDGNIVINSYSRFSCEEEQ